MIPAFMLRQLYEKGSLKNVVDEKGNVLGFSFSLLNRLGSGTIEGGFRLTVDGEEIPLEKITIEKGDVVVKAEEFAKTPTLFTVGDRIKFTVEKPGGLQPGLHKIVVSTTTMEYGKIEFDFSDNIS
ncbi:MAG: hypothetical protein HA496_05970 [Thaumarchaeota archaeon]|jgi:hypothetical protein|nr:hypothetical protein [Nitrososphaerota archaeon]